MICKIPNWTSYEKHIGLIASLEVRVLHPLPLISSCLCFYMNGNCFDLSDCQAKQRAGGSMMLQSSILSWVFFVGLTVLAALYHCTLQLEALKSQATTFTCEWTLLVAFGNYQRMWYCLSVQPVLQFALEIIYWTVPDANSGWSVITLWRSLWHLKWHTAKAHSL